MLRRISLKNVSGNFFVLITHLINRKIINPAKINQSNEHQWKQAENLEIGATRKSQITKFQVFQKRRV